MNNEEFAVIDASGTYCGSVMAIDDSRVESEETHTVSLTLNGNFIGLDLLVIVTDNDSKCLFKLDSFNKKLISDPLQFFTIGKQFPCTSEYSLGIPNIRGFLIREVLIREILATVVIRSYSPQAIS